MMGTKKLAAIQAELIALLGRLPGRSPREWLAQEIESARRDGNRDVQTLEALCAALERAARKGRKPKSRGGAARR
jgi:hypothetical protein